MKFKFPLICGFTIPAFFFLPLNFNHAPIGEQIGLPEPWKLFKNPGRISLLLFVYSIYLNIQNSFISRLLLFPCSYLGKMYL